MKLLALDTATEACSVAVLCDGQIHAHYQLAPREHTQLILPMCEAVLAQAGITRAQLDAIAFGRGPGSFTGVRVAAAVAQGVALALDVPVVPVSSLAALAHGWYRETGAGRVLAAIDARMGEVYWGAYQCDAMGVGVLLGQERVCAAQTIPLPTGAGWQGAGTGWGAYADALRARLGAALTGFEPARYPHAHDIALLAEAAYTRGEAAAPELAQPVYLRDNVVAR